MSKQPDYLGSEMRLPGIKVFVYPSGVEFIEDRYKRFLFVCPHCERYAFVDMGTQLDGWPQECLDALFAHRERLRDANYAQHMAAAL